MALLLGITKLLGAPGLTTRNKEATRNNSLMSLLFIPVLPFRNRTSPIGPVFERFRREQV